MSWVTDCKWESTRDEASEVCRRREKSLDFILIQWEFMKRFYIERGMMMFLF